MKRFLDALVSGFGLCLVSPVLLVTVVLVWLEDRHSPFYVAPRIGRGGRQFQMVKLRSMVVNADKTGVASTASDDPRITRVGRFVRRFKLDELTQLWNVLLGHMSLVGPRPQVASDVQLYTTMERRLLHVRPGITDFASIVFADEGEILEGALDPDLRYNQVIRPWKSRLGLHYIAVANLVLDLRLIVATLMNAISRPRALAAVVRLLEATGADARLIAVARRDAPLPEAPPPGADEVVRSQAVNPTTPS